jgi:hypothetical protein
MNFLEAVKALKEGKCEGITCSSSNSDKPIVRKLELNNKFIAPPIDSVGLFLSEDWQLVNEVKQNEEVEVVGYYHVASGDVSRSPWGKGEEQIKLTGTMKREIKPKVKHRVLIGCLGQSNSFKGAPLNADLFAEWEE